ncbi:hypothetical protein CHT99_09520 [Sphingobacterium cellulitidis]|nr:hypothetical protein CHT99_09520 [Sphingobacterium cellulitidis]
MQSAPTMRFKYPLSIPSYIIKPHRGDIFVAKNHLPTHSPIGATYLLYPFYHKWAYAIRPYNPFHISFPTSNKNYLITGKINTDFKGLTNIPSAYIFDKHN